MREFEPSLKVQDPVNQDRKIKTWRFIKGFSEADAVLCLASVCLNPIFLVPSALVAGVIWHTADRKLKKLHKSDTTHSPLFS